MAKDKQIEVKIEIPAWIVERAKGGCNIQRTLEDEVGREVVKRALAEAKK